MNSDNTGMDITGEKVHTDKKKKKQENDHLLLLHLQIQGGKINVNRDQNLDVLYYPLVLLDINGFLFTPMNYLFKVSLPNCEPKLREKKLQSNINFECT